MFSTKCPLSNTPLKLSLWPAFAHFGPKNIYYFMFLATSWQIITKVPDWGIYVVDYGIGLSTISPSQELRIWLQGFSTSLHGRPFIDF